MVKKIVAFFIRHFGERGTEISAYNYADYNERILGNRSIIIGFTKGKYALHNLPYVESVVEKFKQRFCVFQLEDYSEIDPLLKQANVDVYYTQTQGLNIGEVWPFGLPKKIKSVVHCVFNTSEPHGNVYIPISNELNKRFGTSFPVLPYMVTLDNTNESIRNELNIPIDAIVYGRHGGFGQFNIPFVKECVIEFAKKNPQIYFLFLNTEQFSQNIPNIIYLPMTVDEIQKRKFINTCDAMIHARSDGETFGLSVAEFAICEKPVITWKHGYDNAHLDILADKAIIYETKEQLYDILSTLNPKTYNMSNNGYMAYTPEKVMAIFNTLVIDS